MDAFQYVSYAQEVIFSPGSVDRLAEAVERFGWRRLMVCTSRSLRANGRAGAVESMLGERLAAVFDRVQPHVQDGQVGEVLALATEHQVDALIGMGGGSPIGMAKAAAYALEEQRIGRPDRGPAPTDAAPGAGDRHPDHLCRV